MVRNKELRDLVLDAAEDLTGISYLKKDGQLMIDAVFMAIETALANGDDVEVRGFGQFRIHDYPGRTVRWVDGTERIVTPRRGVKFSPGSTLKRVAAQGIVRPSEKVVK